VIALFRRAWHDPRIVEQELTDTDVQGLKHLKRLLPLFAALHEVGCGRIPSGGGAGASNKATG